MFAGLFLSRVAFEYPTDPLEPVYALPVVLLAISLGRGAGLAAGCVALALGIMQRRANGLEVDAWVVMSRTATYVLLGVMLGHYAGRGRRTRRSLEEAEDGYQALLERVPAIVYTAEYGPEGAWSYVSPRIESILGYSVEEWVDRPEAWYQCLHPEDREQALGAEERSGITGEPLDSEYRMIARDGRVIWFRDQATVVHDEQGRPVVMQGVMLDITSRKRAEDELELRYVVQTRLAEAASLNEGLEGVLKTVAARFNWELGAFWVLDDHDDALRLTDMWHAEGVDGESFERSSRALRLGQGEGLPGQAWSSADPIWVEDVLKYDKFKRVEAAEACGLRGAVAFSATAGNQVRGVLEFFSREPRRADPEVLALLPAVSAQVANFVATQAALEEHRGRFQAVLDNAPAVVYAKDTQGRYLFVNRRFEQVLGVPCEEVVGQMARDLFGSEVAQKLSANDARVFELDGQIEVEEIVPLADGDHTFLSVKFPLRDATGSAYAVCGISTDVTELKRVQQELDGREELARSNRAKSAFLSRVSHELRTPLNAILGFGQVLEVESLNDRQRNSVDQIMKGGRHLLELVNDLLEVSRIESGEVGVSLGPVDLAWVVQDIALLMDPLAAEQGISIVSRADPGLPHVLADEQRVKQVVLNLLSNAIKYNRHGGGVDLHVTMPRDGHVAVRITDTGHGIAEKDLGRLFSPFDRLGAEQTSVEGTGLGLALSKLMVEAMDGRLEVSSVAGVGSTFIVELPAATAASGPGQGESDRDGKALAQSGR